MARNESERRAAKVGAAHRDDYLDEFGELPRRGGVGDWDSTGWAEAWREVVRDDPAADYVRCREAYEAALFSDRFDFATD